MINFKDVRIPWFNPPYPPYHTGHYLEEFFYNFYIKNKHVFDETGYTLLPIFWTTAYLLQKDLTPYINSLPTNLKYFCVSQHDDSIKETLPEDTIVFSAGGNSGGIPLPLVCSSIPKEYISNTNKDIFCSFVGSNTHKVRQTMIDVLKDNPLFTIQANEWSWYIDNNSQNNFLNTISRSKFTLCPRGYGAQSFRFYEALQLGSIPVYIHDDNKWLPYSDILDWSKFSITLHINEIKTLPGLLLSIDTEQISCMVKEGLAAYNNFFKMKNIPTYVLNHLKQQ